LATDELQSFEALILTAFADLIDTKAAGQHPLISKGNQRHDAATNGGMTMYRTGFERICDAIANMQNSLGEGTQWAFAALCFGVASAVLLNTLMAV